MVRFPQSTASFPDDNASAPLEEIWAALVFLEPYNSVAVNLVDGGPLMGVYFRHNAAMVCLDAN